MQISEGLGGPSEDLRFSLREAGSDLGVLRRGTTQSNLS